MAKVNVTYPDGFISMIENFSEREEDIIRRALEEAGKLVVPEYKAQTRAAIGKNLKIEGRSTGELVDSIGVTEVDYSPGTDTYTVKIGFNEPRRKQYKAKGKRSYNEATNAMVANVLEYGKRAADQPPRKFTAKTKSKMRKPAQQKVEQIFREELQKMK